MAEQSRVDLPITEMIALARRYHVRELSLFGSILRSDFTEGSDVDILVDFEPNAPVGIFEFVRLRDEFSQLLGRDVDLVPQAGLKRFVRDEVLRDRLVLLAN